MLEFSLADMKGSDGSSLRFEVESESSEYAVRIVSKIEVLPVFRGLNVKISSPRLVLYFQHIVKKEIYPFIRQACVIKWYKRECKRIKLEESTVSMPETGILPKLKECWEFEDVPVYMVSSKHFYKHGSLFRLKR